MKRECHDFDKRCTSFGGINTLRHKASGNKVMMLSDLNTRNEHPKVIAVTLEGVN